MAAPILLVKSEIGNPLDFSHITEHIRGGKVLCTYISKVG